MSATLTFQPIVSDADLDVVAALALDIWEEFYVPIIGRAQVDYMVGKFQSREAMRAQIVSGYEYFMIRLESRPVGYIAVEVKRAERELFLSKFYLSSSTRGTGLGRRAMTFVEELATLRELASIWLTVNKNNPSVQIYEKLGFVNERSFVADIGGGFVMDDYVMRKVLTVN
jgi:ribosomal protein S18 acetylase RimI-like enzyme